LSSHARICLAALLALALAWAGAPSAHAASFGVKPASFSVSVLGPGTSPFTQASGHPAALTAQFELLEEGASQPGGELQSLTLDFPVGTVLDPQAAGAQCELAAFDAEAGCATDSKVGGGELTLYDSGHDTRVSASLYELVPPSGSAGELGLYIPRAGALAAQYLLLKDVISPIDYHEALQLQLPSDLDVIRASLTLEDTHAPSLLTLPSACSSAMSWGLTVGFSGGASEAASYDSSGVQGCQQVPFAPALTTTAQSSAFEQPDGLRVLASVPEDGAAGFSSDIALEHLALPAGLTLNPAALATLQDCSAVQAAIGQEGPSSCPAGSQIGSASILTPLIPAAITGTVYLAEGEAPPGGSNAQYPIYLELENQRYGTTVRLRGTLDVACTDGRMELSLDELPQLPIEELALELGGGSSTLLANPLSCGAEQLEAELTPYSTMLASPAQSAALTTTGCPVSIPFDPTQALTDSTPQAGAFTAVTIAFARSSAQQYLGKLKSLLPRGLLARIPAAQQCPEALAAKGECAQSSEVGSASIEAGAGGTATTLTGHLFLTGSYDNAPYGISLEIPAAAGPLEPGALLAHLKLSIQASSAQLLLEASLPRIVAGVPLRARRITLSFDRSGFIRNPTACSGLKALTRLTGFTPGSGAAPTRSLSSSLAINGCHALAFKPALAAASSSRVASNLGANLEATLTVPAGEADVKSLLLQLPRQLALRASTVAHSCAEKTFDVNPYSCPGEAFVGGASASTPLLGGRLTGPAILVVHAQTNIPQVFLVLDGDGVRLFLTGSFRSVNGITFLAFAEPDLPLGTLSLNLASGPHSALALVPRAAICPVALQMPTVVSAWNSAEVKLDTTIKPLGCGVRIVGHKVVGDIAYLTVQTFSAGRISASGPDLSTTYRHLGAARRASALLVRLSPRVHIHGRALRIRLRVGFVPVATGARSSAYVTVNFR
jgi:hypothetical protein